jgi:peptide deformylase
MKRLKVIKDPHPVLRQRAQVVPLPLLPEDETLLTQLLDYVEQSQEPGYAEKHRIREGIGLAAPQVGISKRLLAISYVRQEKRIRYALANPIILSSSVKQIALQSGEGCLSVDEPYQGYVYRAFKISVKAYDLLTNQTLVIDASGFDAIVLQHEMDHLNGVLFYDHLNPKDPFAIRPNSELL